jgi:membrane fusion protein (multidrug efflux system)
MKDPARKPSRRWTQRLLWILGPVLVLAGGVWYLAASGRYVTTDNAYLYADVVTIAPQVAGRVVEVPVTENQRVRAGDLLFRIDPQPYQLAVDELQAQALAIGEHLDSWRDGYQAAIADLASKQADLDHATQLFQRVEELSAKGVASQESLDDAANAVATARADRDAARANVAKAKSLLGGDADAPVQQLSAYKIIEARLAIARLDVSHAEVVAPVDGIIGKKKLQVGDFLNVGQPAMPLVSETIWVDANIKETDMTWVRPGQKATFTVDAYPQLRWQAEVASISPASGVTFSVLPAQNATGNWVKVVQRIPVRLRILTRQTESSILRSGMSAEIVIDTGAGHSLKDRWFGIRDLIH